MKKYLQHIAMCVILLFSCSVIAQKAPTAKKERAEKIRAIDKEIKQFTSENENRYNLTPERIREIQTSAKRFELSNSEVKRLSQKIKAGELKKLYFDQNPEAYRFITEVDSIAIDSSYLCEIGSFENEYEIYNYVYISDVITDNLDVCTAELDLTTGVSPVLYDDFDVPVTIVTNNNSVYNGSDMILDGLGINIPRVNSGGHALKLNDNYGDNTVTKIHRRINYGEDKLTFSYNFIAQDPGGDLSTRPAFTIKLTAAATNQVIDEICIVADQNNTALFNSIAYGPEPNVPLVYTNWQCVTLSSQGYAGDAWLDIIVSDGYNPKYFGTLYLDDICNDRVCRPYVGLELDINEIKCRPLPLQVCGTYLVPLDQSVEPPVEGTLDDLALNIYKADGSTLVNTLTNGTFADGVFCFDVLEVDLGTPMELQYEFEAVGNFTLNGYSFTLKDMSSNYDYDLDLTDCYDCTPHLLITADVSSPNLDEQEAKYTITAENEIASGAGAIYHAGNYVLLTDGFLAAQGSKVRIYNEGCTADFVARPAMQQPIKQDREVTIDLVKIEDAIAYTKVYPNPAVNLLTVETSDSTIRSVRMVSLDGKVVLEQKMNSDNNDIDISTLKTGLYILNIENDKGEISSHKIIKK